MNCPHCGKEIEGMPASRDVVESVEESFKNNVKPVWDEWDKEIKGMTTAECLERTMRQVLPVSEVLKLLGLAHQPLDATESTREGL